MQHRKSRLIKRLREFFRLWTHTLGMNEATARKALSRARMAVRNEYVKRYQEKAI